LQTKVKLQQSELIGKFLRRQLGRNEEIDYFYYIPDDKKYIIDNYNKNNLQSPIIEYDILS